MTKISKTTRISNKTVAAYRDQFISAWTRHAPEATFAGYTLAQFTVASEDAISTRALLVDAKAFTDGLINDRNRADSVMNDMMVVIAKSVRGDVDYGEDSNLYRALGFVTLSDRKTGLTRKLKTPVAQPLAPAAANAA